VNPRDIRSLRSFLTSLFYVQNRWLHQYYPTYFVLKDDLPISWYLLVASSTDTEIIYNVNAGGPHTEKTKEAVVLYLAGPLQGLALMKFNAMDAWFEEDEEIFLHPKDPYKVRAPQRLEHPYCSMPGPCLSSAHRYLAILPPRQS
jgi:hypothetical protein